MSNVLTQASDQWARRPSDERFESVSAMREACHKHYSESAEANVKYADLELSADDSGLALLSNNGNLARFSHYSFGQFASRMGAPAGYLRSLPSNVAADVLNHHLRNVGSDGAQLLLHNGEDNLTCRSFTSEQYSRIWNWEILDRLQGIASQGWKTPPARAAMNGQPGSRPATADDIGPRTINLRIGDTIAPAGLYASDHDMFCFLVNEEVTIDDGTKEGLARGVFVSNSEVGAASLRMTRFLYRRVCGNHIVWDAKDVREVKIVHRGDANRRYGAKLIAEMTRYSNESTDSETLKIAESKRVMIGNSKDEVLDALFGKRGLGLSKTAIETAYDAAVIEASTHEGFAPGSAWGMVQGITASSQTTNYADERVKLDRAAGKVLQMTF